MISGAGVALQESAFSVLKPSVPNIFDLGVLLLATG